MDIHGVRDLGTGELKGLAGNLKIQMMDGERQYKFGYGLNTRDHA